MDERTLRRVWLGTAAVVALCAVASLGWSVRGAAGVLAGGIWNLASLWCLVHLLNAWLGPHPSRRRAIAWLVLKFPLLYLLAAGVLLHQRVSVVGFGLGFTVVLLVIVGWFALQARRMTVLRPHGR
jgi:hypothetical protein